MSKACMFAHSPGPLARLWQSCLWSQLLVWCHHLRICRTTLHYNALSESAGCNRETVSCRKKTDWFLKSTKPTGEYILKIQQQDTNWPSKCSVYSIFRCTERTEIWECKNVHVMFVLHNSAKKTQAWWEEYCISVDPWVNTLLKHISIQFQFLPSLSYKSSPNLWDCEDKLGHFKQYMFLSSRNYLLIWLWIKKVLFFSKLS